MHTAPLSELPPAPLRCPQCGADLPPQHRLCPSCGLQPSVAAALAEQTVLARMPAAGTAPLVERVMPRFGEFLRDNGYITEAQLFQGLARQQALAAAGRRMTIGQTLLEMKHITRQALDAAGVQHVRLYQEALHSIIAQLENQVAERTGQLRQTAQKLTEFNEIKANFVANVSHELRTPLVPIKGYLDMLAGGVLGAMNAEQLQALAVVQRSLDRLEELINELILFASGVKGQLVIAPTVFTMSELAARLERYFSPRAAQAGVRLRVEVPPDCPLFSADGEKLYWVLFQLLDNALKFTSQGGEALLAAVARDGRVRVLVRDSGPGIPPDRLQEIFEPFHKLSEGTPERLYGGTGLGLSLAQRILEAHGTRLEVTSQPGQGTAFAFEFPYAAA